MTKNAKKSITNKQRKTINNLANYEKQYDDKRKNEQYKAAYNKGHEMGFWEGHENGYLTGHQNGYYSGYQDGYTAGNTEE